MPRHISSRADDPLLSSIYWKEICYAVFFKITILSTSRTKKSINVVIDTILRRPRYNIRKVLYIWLSQISFAPNSIKFFTRKNILPPRGRDELKDLPAVSGVYQCHKYLFWENPCKNIYLITICSCMLDYNSKFWVKHKAKIYDDWKYGEERDKLHKGVLWVSAPKHE